jgi:hypothetical protein
MVHTFLFLKTHINMNSSIFCMLCFYGMDLYVAWDRIFKQFYAFGLSEHISLSCKITLSRNGTFP